MSTKTIANLLIKYEKFCDKYISVECLDGWYDVIENCFELLENVDGQIPQVVQIKEKFGTLRFYVNGVSNEIYAKITKLEQKSATICEFTGKDGEPHVLVTEEEVNSRGTGWLKTVNKEFAKTYIDNGRKFMLWCETNAYKASRKDYIIKTFYEQESS